MPLYPIAKYRFKVTWSSEQEGTHVSFKEVTGLEVTTEVIEYREGAMAENYKIIQPGMQTFGEVTLKKGVFTGNPKMWDWWNLTADNISDFSNAGADGGRRTVTVQLLNNQSPQQPVVTWTLRNAWPIKVNFDDLNAESNEIMIETLTLRHEGLTTRWE